MREASRHFPRDRAAFDQNELTGEATWYGSRFQGRSTANGEPFDMYRMTAAHRELPFNSIVRVTRDDDRRSVVVRINDRGPGSAHRVIDLSWAAAYEIGMVEQGHTDVRLEIVHWGDGAIYE
ncbi:MAG: rare lipoprotein A [Bradymonadia bacterium]|jgi:rare lipoprotein A